MNTGISVEAMCEILALYSGHTVGHFVFFKKESSCGDYAKMSSGRCKKLLTVIRSKDGLSKSFVYEDHEGLITIVSTYSDRCRTLFKLE